MTSYQVILLKFLRLQTKSKQYGKHSPRYFGPYLLSRLKPSDKDKINLVSFKESIRKKDLTVLLEDNCCNYILSNLN